MNLDQQKDDLLLAALEHVPFDGWSDVALQQGANDLGLSHHDVVRCFPKGAIDAIVHMVKLGDLTMLDQLHDINVQGMKIRDRITTAIMVRFEQWDAHKESIRKALSVLAMPQHATTSMKVTYGTVDAIWKGIGDTSADFNFYTKRASLAGVYGATVLYWLNDSSADNTATKAFLDRRINDVMRIGKARQTVTKVAKSMPDPFKIIKKVRTRHQCG
jgi:ubiquinone biosynthesis protein COQ9